MWAVQCSSRSIPGHWAVIRPTHIHVHQRFCVSTLYTRQYSCRGHANRNLTPPNIMASIAPSSGDPTGTNRHGPLAQTTLLPNPTQAQHQASQARTPAKAYERSLSICSRPLSRANNPCTPITVTMADMLLPSAGHPWRRKGWAPTARGPASRDSRLCTYDVTDGFWNSVAAGFFQHGTISAPLCLVS